MIKFPRDLEERVELVNVAMSAWDLNEREEQEYRLEQLLSSERVSVDDIKELSSLREELREVFRVVDTYAQPGIGVPDSLELKVERAGALQRRFKEQESRLYQAVARAERDYYEVAGQDATVDEQLLERAHFLLDLLEEYDAPAARERRKGLQAAARQANKHAERSAHERDLDRLQYQALTDLRERFWELRPEEELSDHVARLESLERNARHLAIYAQRHRSDWTGEAEELLLDVENAYQEVSRQEKERFDEALYRKFKGFVKKGIVTVAMLGAVATGSIFVIKYQEAISAPFTTTEETTSRDGSEAYKSEIASLRQATAQAESEKERLRTELESLASAPDELEIPASVLASSQQHPRARYFIYADLTGNRTRLYERQGEEWQLRLESRHTDGRNTSYGPKEREWDGRTPTGDYRLARVEKHPAESKLGSRFLRIATPFPGNGLSGTEKEAYLAAIATGKDVANACVILPNETITRLATSIRGEEARTRVLFEKPARPVYNG